MCKFGPAPLPRSGYELMALPTEQERLIREIAKKNTEDGSWDQAVAAGLDMEDPYFWAYWMTKSVKTIRKPLLGHEELTALFNEKKGSAFCLNGGTRAQKPIYMSFAGDLLKESKKSCFRSTLFLPTWSRLFLRERLKR